MPRTKEEEESRDEADVYSSSTEYEGSDWGSDDGKDQGQRSQPARWTNARLHALQGFVRRADAVIGPPEGPAATDRILARQAMAELGPGVLGDKGVGSIEAMIPVVRRADDGRWELRKPYWTAAQSRALDAFVRAEEEEAAVNGRPLSESEIARRAVAQLVPAVVGNRSFAGLDTRIRRIRRTRPTKTRRTQAQLKEKGRAVGHWTAEQKQALAEFVRRQESEAARAGEILHSMEITRRAIAELADVLADRTFRAVNKMVQGMRAL